MLCVCWRCQFLIGITAILCEGGGGVWRGPIEERGHSIEKADECTRTSLYLYLVLHMIPGTVCTKESTSQDGAPRHSTAGQGTAPHGTSRLCAARLFYLFIYFFCHPVYYPRTTFALPPSSNRVRGRTAGPLPSQPRYVPSFFLFLSREELSIFFPRRLASNCAYPRC